MTCFVLVHGAWYGSWCWTRVRSALQANGHDVFTPTLTGVGERSHLLTRDVTLETHILDVVNLIRWEDLSEVVLCGHSYGGCVISGVADRVPERIRSLVYLDAFVLENGENQLQHLPDKLLNQLLEGTRNVGEGWKVPPIPAEVFKVNANDRDWVNRQGTAQPIATMQERISLGDGIESVRNVTYIFATGWMEDSPFPQSYERAKARAWKTVTVGCGHDVMLDRPEQLTSLLLDAAATPQLRSGSRHASASARMR